MACAGMASIVLGVLTLLGSKNMTHFAFGAALLIGGILAMGVK